VDVLAVSKLLIVQVRDRIVALGLGKLENLLVEALNPGFVLQVLDQLSIEPLIELYVLLLEVVIFLQQSFVVLLVRVEAVALDPGLQKLVLGS